MYDNVRNLPYWFQRSWSKCSSSTWAAAPERRIRQCTPILPKPSGLGLWSACSNMEWRCPFPLTEQTQWPRQSQTGSPLWTWTAVAGRCSLWHFHGHPRADWRFQTKLVAVQPEWSQQWSPGNSWTVKWNFQADNYNRNSIARTDF